MNQIKIGMSQFQKLSNLHRLLKQRYSSAEMLCKNNNKHIRLLGKVILLLKILLPKIYTPCRTLKKLIRVQLMVNIMIQNQLPIQVHKKLFTSKNVSSKTNLAVQFTKQTTQSLKKRTLQIANNKAIYKTTKPIKTLLFQQNTIQKTNISTQKSQFKATAKTPTKKIKFLKSQHLCIFESNHKKKLIKEQKITTIFQLNLNDKTI